MAARKAKFREQARQRAASTCRCVTILLRAIEAGWESILTRTNRRRNSAKLYLYHLAAGTTCFVAAIASVVLYNMFKSWVWNHYQTCVPPMPIVYDSDLRNYTVDTALVCVDDPRQAACASSWRNCYEQFVFLGGFVAALQFICSGVLGLSFRKFTNLPQERLQFDQATKSTMLYGGICKCGPLATKSLQLVQGFICLLQIGLVALGTCKGDLARTYNCQEYQSDCAFNKLNNCKYYHAWCSANNTLMPECFTVEGMHAFSGRMDIRLLSPDPCVRCAILEDDRKDNLEDEFWLLNESDRTNPDAWRCKRTAESCFDTFLWPSIACECEAFRKQLNLDDASISAWWSDLQSGCSSRRLNAPGTSNISTGDELLEDDLPDATPSPSLEGEVLSGVMPSPSSEGQPCGTAPSHPYFYYTEQECNRGNAQSEMYMLIVAHMWFIGSLWSIIMALGQAVRLMSSPEPWFYNPNSQREGIWQKLLRHSGP